ncbi:PHP domain-containing protein [Oceanicoccus sp. KOV_DT_Chl]|uniref:PHP domain-containing protein n=1 Tax=Oceanicoccus sp. KOV_DT_Chl TaxID=1904639 RepID=UPI000C7ABB05|nr:PHP domain-containing protein [Oceanicoccus sp. KOV_DT_Chl]
MIVDFHSHSTASDGSLTALELVQRARQQGVELLSITDHDTLAAYRDLAGQSALHAEEGMHIVTGTELSCTWSRRTIHVVGLNIDLDNPVLLAGVKQLQQARLERAHIISERLAKLGFGGGYEYAAALAGDSQIGRPHFARFLLEKGHVSSESEAFKRYLGAGKTGDVKQTWPLMAEVIGWIIAAGGIAVLAHPLHYKMTATKLRALVTDFKAAGGQALEVISGKQAADRTQYLAKLCEQFQLAGSIGSDFHRPGAGWGELGQMGRLPAHCQPVWALFNPALPSTIFASPKVVL